ncbi:MAG TPA: PAS domain S-box protein [Candidatus Limnocylindria bacterium]|nr:PAS domain S-box protein [Candidatus Limnocylindria bacterium]
MAIDTPSSTVASPLVGPLQHAVEEATRLLHADGAMIYLLDAESGVLRCATDAGIGDPVAAKLIRELELPVGKGMFGTAVSRGRVVATSDYLGDRGFQHADGADSIARKAHMRAMAVAPLVADGEALGALGAYVRHPKPFDEAQIGLLKALAEHAAVTLANQRLMQELAESEERYRYLVEHSPDVVWATDRAGNFSYLSETLLPLSGYRPEELIGRHWSTIVAPEDRETFQASWRVAQGESGEQRHRYRLLHRDGRLIPVELRGREAVIAGKSIGAHGSIRDITEVDRLERDLRRQTEELAVQVEAGRSLAEIAAQLTTMRGADAILQRTVDEAARLLQADAARIDLAERGSTVLHWRFVNTGAEQRFPQDDGDNVVNVDEGLSGRAVKDARVVWTGDYLEDRSFHHGGSADAYVAKYGLRSVMAAPLFGEGQTLGTLTVSALRPDAFGESDANLLGALATQAAIAVSNARLYEDLRDSERRYRHLVDNSPDIVWSIDAKGRLTFLSDSLERRTGWKPQDLLGRPFQVLADDSMLPVTEAAFAAVRERPDEEQRLRVTLPLADGHRAPVEITMMGVLVDGKFAGAHGSVRDVTEQARLETSLRDQSKQLERQLESQKRLLEINQGLLSMLDPSDVFESIASALKQVVDYDNLSIYRVDRDARVLHPVLSLDRHADEVMRFDIPFGAGMINWVVEHCEPLLANDAIHDPRAIQIPGTASEPEAVAIVPLRSESEVIGALNISRVGGEEVYFTPQDFELVQLFAAQAAIAVTNARLYEDLQESERRYRYLVDNSPDMIWAVDEEGRFTFVSDSVRQLTGYDPAEVIGAHWERLAAPESVGVAQERWERMRAEPLVEQQMRIDMLRSDGSRIPVEVNMMASVADGRFAGAHGAVRDIGERERLERDLRRQAAELAASGERANLARELHDSVTQALFSMGLTARSLELLLDSDPQAARQKLQDLRDLQKDALAEMRTLIFELRPASLEQDGLAQAIRTHAASVEGRTGLAVEVSCPTDDFERPSLDVEEALYRIAQEALHNVVKHANARSVRIALGRDRNRIRLSVEDDGTGFDPERVPRGHLGLHGMRQRADAIGGTMGITSTLGHGTRIEVEVPLPTTTSAE